MRNEPKIMHLKGFDYLCTKVQLNGQWVTSWYFKPEGETIYLCYSSYRNGYEVKKPVKQDMEALLLNTDAANSYYREKLATFTNIEAARSALKEALSLNEKEDGLGSNNPGKLSSIRHSRQFKLSQAKSHLESVERCLTTIERSSSPDKPILIG